MRKIFGLLSVLLIVYGCFVGYRMYKNRVDSIFVEKILKVNKNHYSKLEKVLKEKREFEQKVISLKNEIEKNKKEIEKINDKNNKKENINEGEKAENEKINEINKTTNNTEDKLAISIKELEEKNNNLNVEVKEYEEFLIEITELKKKLEKINSDLYSFLKKCQLNFISSKLKNEVIAFLADYENQENDLDKLIEKNINSAKSLKEKYTPKEKKSNEKNKDLNASEQNMLKK